MAQEQQTMNEYMNHMNRMKIQSQTVQQSTKKKQKPYGKSVFNEFLEKAQQVKFSKHASQRLSQRDIQLTPQEMERLSSGVNKAKSKGVRSALIMMDNKVFVASVTNNTVITASTEEQLKEQVFTNIDGAVIV